MGRLVFPLLLGLVGAAILAALGVWQLQRLAWKEAVLAAIEARLAAPPVVLPAVPDPDADAYLAVAAEGAFLPGEALVLASPRGLGPGYRLITPFETADGQRILVDRGFLPEARRHDPRPPGPARIEGNLHWPDEADRFTPPPDAAAGLWFARDVPALAAALGTEPVLVVLRASDEAAPPARPLPLDTAAIPNDHLEYALTWFALAAVWLGMTGFLILRIRRGTA
jgi:surfeit locus 1 family protein